MDKTTAMAMPLKPRKFMGQAAAKALLMKPRECAELADCSTRTITRLCERGELDACRFGRSWRINRESFMRRIGAVEA